MIELAKDGECDGFLVDTLTKDGRNLFDFISEADLRDMVFEGKQLGMSTALSGHLKLDDLDGRELARINPDIVGVRGAVCSKGDRNDGVYWEAVAEFKRQISLRETGEVAVHANVDRASVNGSPGGWLIIDGTGKTCAGILAALTEQVERDRQSLRRGDNARRAQRLRHHRMGGEGRPHDTDAAPRRRRLYEDPRPALALSLFPLLRGPGQPGRLRSGVTFIYIAQPQDGLLR